MSSAFCSLDEAFAGPVVPGKKKDKSRNKERVPETMGAPEPMAPPPDTGSKPEAAMGSSDFFPLPGETAEPEEWAKAFTLEGSNMPRPDGSIPVAGKPTLWRKIPAPAPAPTAAPVVPDINQRLDALTRQLESLTGSSQANPMQSTAELFLFIAIGLLFILAMDTLLRCATTIALAKPRGLRSMLGGGRGLGRKWGLR